jgi:predicted metalloprotease with PDZ domain
VDLTTAIGLMVKADGTIVDVVPGKAADRAGVAPGMKLVAVNGRRLSEERLRPAVAATHQGAKLALLLENGDYFQTVTLDYADGEKYPYLDRDSGRPDLLADIFRPRAENGPR